MRSRRPSTDGHRALEHEHDCEFRRKGGSDEGLWWWTVCVRSACAVQVVGVCEGGQPMANVRQMSRLGMCR
jgi:hypothetical protein